MQDKSIKTSTLDLRNLDVSAMDFLFNALPSQGVNILTSATFFKHLPLERDANFHWDTTNDTWKSLTKQTRLMAQSPTGRYRPPVERRLSFKQKNRFSGQARCFRSLILEYSQQLWHFCLKQYQPDQVRLRMTQFHLNINILSSGRIQRIGYRFDNVESLVVYRFDEMDHETYTLRPFTEAEKLFSQQQVRQIEVGLANLFEKSELRNSGAKFLSRKVRAFKLPESHN